jgi:outer membrane autotransporter protein
LLTTGTTSLTIENGSTLTSAGIGGIASNAASTITVTVTGAGSLWNVGGQLNVGGVGTGTLNIENGGEVNAQAGTTVGLVGSTASGTLNISSGGILATTKLIRGAGAAQVNFDDATLRALASNPAFISVLTVAQLNIAAGGLTVDTNGFSIGAPGFSGAGGLTVAGSGTFTLSDVSTYAGPTAINSGSTLALATAGSIAASSRLVDNGTFDISGLTGTGISIQTLAGSGTVATGTKSLTLTNASDTFAGAFTGSGALTLAGGTETLTGNSSAFTGATNVQSGTLAVNGTLGGTMDVQSGATLQGNGTVGATTIHAGGVIAPGNSIGTLNVNGAFAQQSGATYQAQLDPNSSASDLIAVNGAASLQSGAILSASSGVAGNYTPNTVYKVLSATGGVTGTYALTGGAVSAFLNIVASYDANDVYLKVVQTGSPGDAAQTGNQTATAGGASGTAVETALLNAQSAAAARAALDQLSGSSQASAKGAMIYDSRYTRALAVDRLRDMFCTAGHGSQPDSTPRPPGASADTGCAVNPGGLAVWGQAFGSWGHSDGNSNAARIDRSASGFVTGIDTAVGNDWRVGVLAGYSASNYGTQNASSDSDDYHFGVYGGSEWGRLALRLGGTYTWHDVSSTRAVALPNFFNSLSAEYNAATSQGFAELGYGITAGAFNLEPYLNLAYVDLHTNGFTEQGGLAALTSRSGDIDTGFTTLGMRASTDFMLGRIAATVRGTVGWMHAYGDITPVSVMSLAGGTPFTVTGIPIATDAAVTEAGFDLHLAPKATLGVSYNGQYGDGAVDQSVRGILTVQF